MANLPQTDESLNSILNVEKEIEKVLDKFDLLDNKSQKSLNDLITSLQHFQRDLVVLSSKYQSLSPL